MKRLLYTIFFISFLFSSCRDDLAIGNENSIGGSDETGISVFIDIPESRTRAVDMTPGAALYLNDIWVGVFRKSDGVRVGGAQLNLGNRMAASGTTLVDLVKLEFDDSKNYKSNDSYCVVGVANYDGIKITNTDINYENSDPDIQKDDLIYALQGADNWKDFIKIAVDTKKSLFPNQTPMLMGYLYLEDSNNTGSGYIYTKVNQFVEDNDNKVNLYPFGILSGYPDIDIFVKDNYSNGKIQSLDTKGYVMKLRRMRSKINVEIETRDEQMVITNLEYKVCNIPNSAFLAQRRTNIFNYSSPEGGYTFESTAAQKSVLSQFSSNSSDVLNDGYEDLDWQKPGTNNSFSFEHFENKHWAYYSEGLEDYHDRERTNDDGSFLNLVGNSGYGSEWWNNKASYFLLKLNLRDEKLGRNAEVEYIIHEGFCNDKDGVTLVDDNGNTLSQSNAFTTRLMDYSSIRNTDYYYKIQVLDVNKIKLQVSTSDHQYDQIGKIWQVNYLAPTIETLSDKTEVTAEVKLKPDNDPDFSNQDIAFRLLGTYYDEEVGQEFNVDVCYNFSHGDLDGFAGIWPAPTNENTDYIINTNDKDGNPVEAFDALTAYCDGTSPNAVYFNKLKDKILIKHKGEYVNIVEYIENIQDESQNPDIQGFQFDGLRLYVAKSSASDKSNIRGLYIFDIQKAINDGTRILTDQSQHDPDGPCSYFYQINGIEQLPVYLAREDYEMIYVKNSGTPTVSEHLQPTVNNTGFTNFNDGHGGSGMLLSEYPDIAFRIVGFNQNNVEYINTTDYYDIWYNIKQDEYTDFTNNGKWPERNLNGILSKEIAKGYLTSNDISKSFLDGIKIIKNSAEVYDLYDFINKYETGQISLTNTDKLGFQVNQYDVTARVQNVNSTESKNKFMRALYLIDKKNPNVVPPLLVENGISSTATFQGYGVEQDPTLLPPLPFTFGSVPSGSHTSKSYVNILTPYIDAISIEPLKSDGNLIPTTDYRFRIYSGTGNNLREAIITPEIGNNGYCTFNIPMIALSGTSGTLYLQALSHIGDEYFSEVFDNSSAVSIGTYSNLSDPPTWNADTDGDFKKAYNYFKDQGSDYKNAYDESTYGRLDYLTFSGGNFGVSTQNSKNTIQLRSNSARISCMIYKPCKVTVTTTGGGGGLDISLNSEIKTSSTNTSVTYTVSKDDFGDKNELELSFKRSTGSSTYVISIQITES